MPEQNIESRPGEISIELIKRELEKTRADRDPISTSLRQAAVAMTLCDLPGQGLNLLFIRRAEHPEDPWSGQIAFPGGHLDPGDSNLAQAAIRETGEELGLVIDDEMLLGSLNTVCPSRTRPYDVVVSPHLFYLSSPPTLTPNHEVAEAFWVPMKTLSNPANVRPYPLKNDPRERVFPSFPYGSHAIWGLTYWMIADLMSRLGVALPTQQDYLR